MTLTTRQVAAGVPIWDLLNEFGMDVGLLTNFPGEGIVFTVRHGDAMVRDYSCATMHAAIFKASEAHAALAKAQDMPDEPYIDDEDADRAFAEMLERRAAPRWGDEDYEIPF